MSGVSGNIFCTARLTSGDIGLVARLAEALGYRLVPITTPQEEHEALLAARVAEDGSIGMREQDIEGAAV